MHQNDRLFVILKSCHMHKQFITFAQEVQGLDTRHKYLTRYKLIVCYSVGDAVVPWPAEVDHEEGQAVLERELFCEVALRLEDGVDHVHALGEANETIKWLFLYVQKVNYLLHSASLVTKVCRDFGRHTLNCSIGELAPKLKSVEHPDLVGCLDAFAFEKTDWGDGAVISALDECELAHVFKRVSKVVHLETQDLDRCVVAMQAQYAQFARTLLNFHHAI